ncbi:UNVERIFIED_CONTAM: Retrovirus-related Pol polyprotein from transposon RE2 [Sesamum angustifolium]|uniref:Retrovirus-related Pol polyprotein from transposon RE2 n=1 Tax=Sesamum angustifolium TaxID=2727405 RepID=A0AAW2JXH5_9LAMI
MGKEKRRMGTQQQSRTNDMCTYYRGKEHWKRDYPNLSSNQGMFVVEVNMVTHSASWVLDTGCGAHICYDLQMLQTSRKLSKNKVVLMLGDGKRRLWTTEYSAITFIDDHSRYGYIYLMRYKSEAFVRFKEFKLEVENQTGLKISPSVRPRFIGYPKETTGYYFYDPSEQKVFTSRNAVFLKRGFPTDTRHDELLFEESSEAPPSNAGTSSAPTVSTDNVPILHRSAIVPQPPERYRFLGVTGQLDNDPKTYGEAMSDIESGKWLEAMKSEMVSMSSNQVCMLVDRPKGVTPVGCKWVYKRKIGADGEVTIFKARLVAKKYTQRPGVDFEETFSPVAVAKSIWIMLAIASWYDYEIWQMDVKTAFFNGLVEEEIYMDQPEGFTVVGEEQKVCHLHRSIYGLKQASRSWNIRFDEIIRGYDFVKNDFDPCVYKKVSGSSVVFLVLYVDDILLIENDIKMLGDTKAWLSTQFSMKDLGEVSYILGIKIFRDRSKKILGMPQNSYVEKVLKKFKMEHSKRGFLPMRHWVKLSKKQSPKTDEELKRILDIPYASAVGSIQYVAQCTRLDIAYALSVTSRYQACAKEAHWTAVKIILKYLSRTKDVFLVYGGGELILEGFSNANFQSDNHDAKLQLGFVFKLNEAAKEAVWMKNYIQDLGAVPSISMPVVIFCDNNGAIAQARELRSHHRSKNILRRYHLLREMVGRGDIRIDQVSSAENIVDPLAKPMSQIAHAQDLGKMGLR